VKSSSQPSEWHDPVTLILWISGRRIKDGAFTMGTLNWLLQKNDQE
jgi:hypothetical protein